jgi:hypothetical protein
MDPIRIDHVKNNHDRVDLYSKTLREMDTRANTFIKGVDQIKVSGANKVKEDIDSCIQKLKEINLSKDDNCTPNQVSFFSTEITKVEGKFEKIKKFIDQKLSGQTASPLSIGEIVFCDPRQLTILKNNNHIQANAYKALIDITHNYVETLSKSVGSVSSDKIESLGEKFRDIEVFAKLINDVLSNCQDLTKMQKNALSPSITSILAKIENIRKKIKCPEDEFNCLEKNTMLFLLVNVIGKNIGQIDYTLVKDELTQLNTKRDSAVKTMGIQIEKNLPLAKAYKIFLTEMKTKIVTMSNSVDSKTLGELDDFRKTIRHYEFITRMLIEVVSGHKGLIKKQKDEFLSLLATIKVQALISCEKVKVKVIESFDKDEEPAEIENTLFILIQETVGSYELQSLLRTELKMEFSKFINDMIVGAIDEVLESDTQVDQLCARVEEHEKSKSAFLKQAKELKKNNECIMA